jgi:large subunit ribosomal protein L25
MEATLKATRRDTRGKNEARRLRQQGQIPAVIYGEKNEATAIAVDPKVLSRILHSEAGVNSLISLEVEGESATNVLVKEYQLEPVRHSLLHADFLRVAMDRVITVTVPLVVKGEPKGVKQQGGVLDFVHREVQIECLPGEIPENIEIEVSELLIGQSVRLRDIAGGVKWKPVSDPDLMLVHVVQARAAAEETPAAAEAAPAAAAGAEPEVIKKGKADKGEAAE